MDVNFCNFGLILTFFAGSQGFCLGGRDSGRGSASAHIGNAVATSMNLTGNSGAEPLAPADPTYKMDHDPIYYQVRKLNKLALKIVIKVLILISSNCQTKEVDNYILRVLKIYKCNLDRNILSYRESFTYFLKV